MKYPKQSPSRFRSVLNTIPFLAIVGIATLLVVILNPPQPEALSAIAFKDFPIDRTQVVDFSTDRESFKRLSDREKKDQQLDWLVYAIASDRDFTADRINQTLYDLPPVRYGYNKELANFEYGDTRQFSLGNGKVVALLPKTTTQEKRIEEIAYIADSYRKNISKIPETVQIFEYELQPGGQSAKLTHRADIHGKDIFTNKYGYHETNISSLADLQNFTAQVNDITYSHRQGNSLLLGGRKIADRPTQNMSVEDIAALWQSEKKIASNPNKYQSRGSGFSLDWDYDYKGLSKDLKEAQSFMSALKLDGKAIVSDRDIQQAQSGLAKRDIIPYLKLIEKLKNNGNIFHAAREKALNVKEKELGILRQKLEGKWVAYDTKVKVYNTKKAATQNQVISNDELNKLNQEAALLNREMEENKTSGDRINKGIKEIDAEIEDYNKARIKLDKILQSKSLRGFQFARYEGELEGTEVGMNLFYTDLIAKLWSFNYSNTTPQQKIPDFYPRTQAATKISSIYKNESLKNDATRLWFGTQDKGFQISDDGSTLIFAHKATQIYSKSANSLNPKQETIATPDSAAFLGWWDNHYADVARYEPQYEKLNQIMKWSLLIGWLNQEIQDNTLDFLDLVNVKHEYWFPDWAQAHKQQLKFQLWDSESHCNKFNIDRQEPVCFYKRGYQDHSTETLPLLHSGNFKSFGQNAGYLYGGVSLADKYLLQQRVPLPKSPEIAESGLRSHIDYKSGFEKIANNGFLFKDYKGTIYKITKSNLPEVASTNAIKAGEGIKLRSPVIEVANLEFTSNISRANDGIQIGTTAGGIPVGDFSTKKTANGFSVGFKSRDIDVGQSLALDLSSSSKTAAEVLKNHPNVQSAYTDGSVYYIETKNSTQLLELTPDVGGGGKGGGGTGGGGNEPPDWHSRVGFPGDPKGSNGNYKLIWKDKKNEYKSGKTKIVDREQIKDIPPIKTTSSLDDIDRALKQNNTELAMQMISAEIATNRRTPTLLFRQAVAHVKQGKLKIQSLIADPLQSKWLEKKGNFLDEVKGILNGNSKFKVVKKDDAFVYVQDTPGLNNIDWNQPIESALPFSSSTKTRVYQLRANNGGSGNNGGIGNNGGSGNGGGNGSLNDFGYEPENPKLIPTLTNDYQVSKGSFSQYLVPIGAKSSDDKCEDGVIRDGKCMKVYIVIETPELEQPIEYSNPQ
jgi:hypothetical protein